MEIPTGVPLLYDEAKRRIRLLDDGLADPLSRHNFGAGAELLFGPEVNAALFTPDWAELLARSSADGDAAADPDARLEGGAGQGAGGNGGALGSASFVAGSPEMQGLM